MEEIGIAKPTQVDESVDDDQDGDKSEKVLIEIVEDAEKTGREEAIQQQGEGAKEKEGED